MLPEKTNISARVEITLKKIVEESSFTHRDVYELRAMLIDLIFFEKINLNIIKVIYYNGLKKWLNQSEV